MSYADAMIETGFGYVNTWQCDENDHLNVQFYAAAMHEADAHLRLALGLPPTNRPGEPGWIAIADDHIRFLAELRNADNFTIRSGIAECSPGRITVFHEMRNVLTGGTAATLVSGWYPREGGDAASAFSASILDRAQALRLDLPEHAQRRSAGVGPALRDINLDEAESLHSVGKGLVHSTECDLTEEMTPAALFGRFSNSGSHIWASIGFHWAELNAQGKGSVVLENYLDFRRPLKLGEAFVIKSFVRDISSKIIGFNHLVFGAQTGDLCVNSELSVVLFDLSARRALPLSEDERRKFARAVWNPDQP